MTITDRAGTPGTLSRRPLSEREWWGYGVWGLMGAVVATTELWAVSGNPWWPTISATTGHLEQLWSPVKLIVVALIAAGAVQLLSYPQHRRTGNGRPARTPGQVTGLSHAEWYFPVAVLVIAGAAAITATLTSSPFTTGYVLYGLIALTLGVIPNVLAFWFAREVPFPTLFRTLQDLDDRWHPAVVIIVAGLSVLAIHLVAYPWP